jgi:hypothetical protein
MKIALFGSSGYLGSVIYKAFQNKYTIFKFGKSSIKSLLKSENSDDYKKFEKKLSEFDVVINCIGIIKKKKIFHNFKNLSFESNVIIPKKLSYICNKLNLLFFHFSTADINFRLFDTYTIHKRIAEQLISENSLVIRPTLVIDDYKKGNFINLLPKINIGIFEIIFCPIPGPIIQPLLEKELISCLLKIVDEIKLGKSYQGNKITLNSKNKYSIYSLMIFSRKPNQLPFLLPTFIFRFIFKYSKNIFPKFSNFITTFRPLQYLFLDSKEVK